ncbi:MAG: SEC-C domain-containing protein, partial [Parasporobacterium sp.]|nr:SEC-C domain-containing protein [Parasporobacterium sp.]
AVPRLKQAMALSAKHVQPEVIMRELSIRERDRYRKVSRNDPCPCGSGMKFKNCCSRYVP